MISYQDFLFLSLNKVDKLMKEKLRKEIMKIVQIGTRFVLFVTTIITDKTPIKVLRNSMRITDLIV